MNEPPESAFPDGKPAADQPRWRQDFPIDVEQDEYVSRRDFAKFLVLTSGAMVAGQLCLVGQSVAGRSHSSPQAKAIASVGDLKKGSVLTFEYPEPGDACLLACLEDGKLVAFGQKCTHLSCAVIPDLATGKFVCPCHEGSFDCRTGEALAGPPRRPLARIVLEVRQGIVYATGVELRT